MLEVAPDHAALVSSLFNQAGVPAAIIGASQPGHDVSITVGGQPAVSGNTAALRCVGWVCRVECSGWQSLRRTTFRTTIKLETPCVFHHSPSNCRDVWESTSFALERLQAAEGCVAQEQAGLASRTAPKWVLPFTPSFTPADRMSNSDKVRCGLGCVLACGATAAEPCRGSGLTDSLARHTAPPSPQHTPTLTPAACLHHP